MLSKIKEIVSRGGKNPAELEPTPGLKLKSPKHIAITIDGAMMFSKKRRISVLEAYQSSIESINTIIPYQIKKNIPIFTFYVLGKRKEDGSNYSELIDILADFFNNLQNHESIKSGKIKVSVIGKWYDLPGRLVDAIKSILESTKNNNEFFLNFCLNYDGQEEIVDACKLLVRQVMASKIDISQIDKSAIKDNLYSSYFMPPDIIIKNGYKKYTKGILLWDSVYSTIYFSEKMWPDFTKSDLNAAIDYWRKN